MKKFRNMLLAVALCVMATFFCAGCSITKHMTVEQYAAVVNAQMESEGYTEQYKSQGLEINIEADGNILVYEYTYTEDLGNIDLLSSTLESSMRSYDDYYSSLLDEIQEEECSALEGIRIEYLTKSGEMIYSKEYK